MSDNITKKQPLSDEELDNVNGGFLEMTTLQFMSGHKPGLDDLVVTDDDEVNPSTLEMGSWTHRGFWKKGKGKKGKGGNPFMSKL